MQPAFTLQLAFAPLELVLQLALTLQLTPTLQAQELTPWALALQLEVGFKLLIKVSLSSTFEIVAKDTTLKTRFKAKFDLFIIISPSDLKRAIKRTRLINSLIKTTKSIKFKSSYKLVIIKKVL